VSFLLAEQNTNVALRYAKYGYILESGRVVLDGEAKRAARERGREGILPRRRRRGRESRSGTSSTTSAASAGWRERTPAAKESASRSSRGIRTQIDPADFPPCGKRAGVPFIA
jgi:hypothetical protein